jgi:hypothetical protein
MEEHAEIEFTVREVVVRDRLCDVGGRERRSLDRADVCDSATSCYCCEVLCLKPEAPNRRNAGEGERASPISILRACEYDRWVNRNDKIL